MFNLVIFLFDLLFERSDSLSCIILSHRIQFLLQLYYLLLKFGDIFFILNMFHQWVIFKLLIFVNNLQITFLWSLDLSFVVKFYFSQLLRKLLKLYSFLIDGSDAFSQLIVFRWQFTLDLHKFGRFFSQSCFQLLDTWLQNG